MKLRQTTPVLFTEWVCVTPFFAEIALLNSADVPFLTFLRPEGLQPARQRLQTAASVVTIIYSFFFVIVECLFIVVTLVCFVDY
jgi:hypothetical protein